MQSQVQDRPMPSVSVIIPAKNAQGFILRALESVFNQTHQPFEVIVVDDHSTDGTYDLVATHYPQVKLARSQEHGVAAARNMAILLSAGDYIANLDADDEWLPNKLERQLPHLSQDKVVLCRAQNFKVINSAYKDVGNQFPVRAPQNVLDYIVFGINVPGSSWIIPRALAQTVGSFNPALSVGSDADFFCRILLAGYSFELIDETMVKRRLHEHNLHVSKYSSGLINGWGVVKMYAKHVKHTDAKSKVYDSSILTLLVLLRFVLRSVNDIRYRSARRRYDPYKLLGQCLWYFATTPLAWLGIFCGAILYVRSPQARQTWKRLIAKWMSDAQYFGAIGHSYRAK